jgi:hypothetical protein
MLAHCKSCACAQAELNSRLRTATAVSAQAEPLAPRTCLAHVNRPRSPLTDCLLQEKMSGVYPAPPAAAAQSRSMASPRRVKNMVPDELLDAKRERQRDEADVLLLQNRLNHLRYRPRARAHSTFA